MNAFKRQCIELRKKDHTLNEIVRITGRPKTSVYTHIHHFPLSRKKQAEIKENTRKFAKQVAASRKGKALRPFMPFKHWTPEMVLLTGHFMFDGELKKSCVYSNRSSALISRVQKLIRPIYNFEPHAHRDPKSGVRRISYHNVALASFLKGKTKELEENIITFPRSHRKEFVRAFFDDEGCMDVRLDRNLRRIRGYQKDKNVLELIQQLLRTLDIESKLQGKNEVVISGKDNLIKFQKQINFSKGVRLNPNRKNSIWKKPIEKRQLLDMAIKSFKS